MFFVCFCVFCVYSSNDNFDKNIKNPNFDTEAHSKDRKSTKDKENISNPNVNRGCPPLTANRTSADCVQISLRPPIPYIPRRVYRTRGFNAMNMWFSSPYVAIQMLPYYQFEPLEQTWKTTHFFHSWNIYLETSSVKLQVCVCVCVWGGGLNVSLGLYSLRRRRLTGIGIPIINLRQSDDRFIMRIPILIRRRLLSE